MGVLKLLLATGFAALPIMADAVASESLAVRNAHAMAYHDGRRTVMLFGGADASEVRGDLWEWDGHRWQQLAADGPPPRTFPAMAYDRARHRLVLFGGNRVLFGDGREQHTFLADHWEWSAAGWQEIRDPTPPARAEAGMAYDEARRRIVLFGGHRMAGGERTRLNDTWEWDGATWIKVATMGPSPRNGAALAYDPEHRRTILFGGNGPSGETWEWDGRRWREIEPALNEGLFNSAMAFDRKRRQLIRFGGWNGDARVGDTWAFDGERWRQLDVTGPAPRNHAAVAYDSRRERLVLFGGHDGDRVFGDTWEWDGRRWSHLAAAAPRMRIANGH
jgi:hypothetical protein